MYLVSVSFSESNGKDQLQYTFLFFFKFLLLFNYSCMPFLPILPIHFSLYIVLLLNLSCPSFQTEFINFSHTCPRCMSVVKVLISGHLESKYLSITRQFSLPFKEFTTKRVSVKERLFIIQPEEESEFCHMLQHG